LAAKSLADWCSVEVVDDGTTSHVVTVAHADPAKVADLEKLTQRYPGRDESRGAKRVMRTGEPEIINDIDDAMLVAAARDDEHLRLLRELNLSAVMVVPM